MEQTRTELHTHLLGMLSAKELLLMVQEYTDYIYWPLDKGINAETRLVKTSDLIHNEEALNQLRIRHDEQVSYEELDSYYTSRTAILNYLVSLMVLSGNCRPILFQDLLANLEIKNYMLENYSSDYIDDNIKIMMSILEYSKIKKQIVPELEKECRKTVFSDYLNRSLLELKKMGVEYVEISYSYEDIISMIEINPKLDKDIKCKFLLSTARDRSIKQMKESAGILKVALSKGMTVGFDIMGQEEQLTDLEKTYSVGKKSKSFKRKLEIIIDTLISSNNGNTLRIHSGESEVSFGNTEWILDTLKEIKDEYLNVIPSVNILPPPELRIGHGLYFEKSEHYIERLKEFGAIIEINASSNKALGNISSYLSLPYDYYLENKIPIVISTDGHGLYDTHIHVEDYIAQNVSKHYDLITQIDDHILERKTRK